MHLMEYHSKVSASSWLKLVILLSLISLTYSVYQASIPKLAKTEGRLTLGYYRGDQILKHQLAFTELLDYSGSRSKVTIGHVSYDPIVYYTKKKSPILFVQDDQCKTSEFQAAMVPEIAWFTNMILPDMNMKDFLNKKPHLIGPTGLIEILLQMSGEDTFSQERYSSLHRNIPCYIFSKIVDVPTKALAIKLDFYAQVTMLNHSLISNTNSVGFFSFKATVLSKQDPNASGNSYFLIDYFNIEDMATQDHHKEQIQLEFNLPLGVGCSQFVDAFRPTVEADSFTISYMQFSMSSYYFVAYDFLHGLIRKDQIGHATSVFDLKESLLYYTNYNISSAVLGDTSELPHGKPCSVIKMMDGDNINSESREPLATYSNRYDLLEMLGINQPLTYMGRGNARNLPCYIFEATLRHPPGIFALSNDHTKDGDSNYKDSDFIFQLYIIQGDHPEENVDPKVQQDQFSPVQMKLFRRDKYDGDKVSNIKFLDQLDIYDFRWSLDGWTRKSGEMFITSECFENDDEQVKVELVLELSEIHNLNNDYDMVQILAHNKFKLEYDTINTILGFFGISKMHLIDYEMKFRPHHIDFIMVVADLDEQQEITKTEPGLITKSNDTLSIDFAAATLEQCLLLAVSVTNVAIVAFRQKMDGQNLCMAFENGKLPKIEYSSRPTKLNQEFYQIYKINNINQAPKQGTVYLDEKKVSLKGFEFEFEAHIPESKDLQSFNVSIEHYDVSHYINLISLDSLKYKFERLAEGEVLASRPIRYYDSLTYSNEGDCARMCDLDTECRSYSYCYERRDDSCMISSLDLRESNILDTKKFVQTITELEGSDHRKYSIVQDTRCRISERDYLSMYGRTDEYVHIEPSLVRQIKTEPTTSECAKRATQLELTSPDQKPVTMFVYCSTNNACILDERLFSSGNNSASISANEDKDTKLDGKDDLVCSVYRRRYQSYFHVSVPVLKRNQEAEQIELSSKTLEDCAKSCWNQYGSLCGSFDYCSDKHCLINKLSFATGSPEVEHKVGCLHYERDLRLDQLRREHLIGRHQLLESHVDELNITDLILRCSLYVVICVSFVVGVYVGGGINDKLESVTILRSQSIFARRRGSQGVGILPPLGANGLTPRNSLDRLDYDDLHRNDIQMDVIDRNSTKISDSNNQD